MNKIYAKYIKRLLDIICSLLVIVFFWWLYVIVAILVRVKLGSPVLFKQERPGKNEKIFKLYKFRTMTDERDAEGNLLPDEKRLTGFGKALRATSLDEIPELFNILKGDMSFVGPRPLLVRYLPYYKLEERRRHAVRPGLTGLAQVNGRNMLSWEERFRYDCAYADHITFAGDIRILFLTLKKVFAREDITMDGNYVLQDLDKERKNHADSTIEN